MTNEAAVKGVLVNFIPFPSRSVAQIRIEVPIEEATQALLALGGFPMPGESLWVVVARMNIIEASPTGDDMVEVAETKQIEHDDEDKPEKTPGQRAVAHSHILDSDEGFIDFLAARAEREWPSGDHRISHFTPAEIIRELCGVEARGEFATDDVALDKWHDLVADYNTEVKYGGDRR